MQLIIHLPLDRFSQHLNDSVEKIRKACINKDPPPRCENSNIYVASDASLVCKLILNIVVSQAKGGSTSTPIGSKARLSAAQRRVLATCSFGEYRIADVARFMRPQKQRLLSVLSKITGECVLECTLQTELHFRMLLSLKRDNLATHMHLTHMQIT